MGEMGEMGEMSENNVDSRIRRPGRIYLSDLIKYYLSYSNGNCETGFDSGFYEWVIATHFRGRLSIGDLKPVTEMEMEVFHRAYAIFSTSPTDAQISCVTRVQDAIAALKHSEAGGCGYNIPHKVKRIMAKYNFIYI